MLQILAKVASQKKLWIKNKNTKINNKTYI